MVSQSISAILLYLLFVYEGKEKNQH